MRLFYRLSTTAFALVMSIGCSGESAANGDDLGTLSLPLQSPSASGVVYQLRDAVFEIRGPVDLDVSSNDFALDAPEISVDLQSGLYDVTLTQWEMWHSAAGQVPSPIVAELLPPNPVTVLVQAAGTATATFRFRVQEGDINFGPGTLLLDFDVEEVPTPQDGCTHLIDPDLIDVLGGTQGAIDAAFECAFGSFAACLIPGQEFIGNPTPARRQALSDCVEVCMESQTPVPLSTTCVACFGARVVCDVAYWIAECPEFPPDPALCESVQNPQCGLAFEICSGLQ